MNDSTRPLHVEPQTQPGGQRPTGGQHPGDPGYGGDPWAVPGGQWRPDPAAGAPQSGGGGRRRGTALLVAVALGAAVLGGAAGAGTYAALDDDPAAAPATAGAPSQARSDGAAQPGTAGGSADAAELASVEDIAAAVLPSVVSIAVAGGGGAGTGTGIVLTEDGTILTNNHVVEGAAGGGSIEVTFHDGTTAAAEVVGRDPLTDLAVIRARGAEGLTPARLGSSAELAVGEQVVAVGSPLGLQGTVTSGIVSALNRPVVTGNRQTGSATVIDAVQTDAPINPGNSGGPLVNMAGEVVGINSAIATSGPGSGSIGLGFAIPIDQAAPIAEELVDRGTATHARLGVSVGEPREGRGALIVQVDPEGAAQAAGIRDGDVVTRVDERMITSGDDLVAAVRSYRPGETVTLTLRRDGEEDTVEVTLGSDEATARS